MKRLRFPPLLAWTFEIGVFLLVVMTLLRFIFFIHFRQAPHTILNSMDAFVLGLRYDFKICCFILLPVFLIGNMNLKFNTKRNVTAGSIVKMVLSLLFITGLILLLKNNKAGTFVLTSLAVLYVLIMLWLFIIKDLNPFNNPKAYKVWKIYFLVLISLFVLFYVVDFPHYDYLHQRLNASVLNYLQDAGISMSLVWQTYPVIRIILAIVLLILFIFYMVHLFYLRLTSKWSIPVTPYTTLLSVGWFLIIAFGIFGRFSQYPLRWSDAFTLGDDYKANLALNPVQSFISTLEFRHSSYDLKKIKQYYPLVASYLGVQQTDSVKLNFERVYPGTNSASKPNVVIVICESFSAYKSSMWGNPLNSTPYFNEMSKHGAFFDHCFTPAYGTARGVWAVITGIPDVESPGTASRNPSAVDQHSIMNDFAGYEKYYFLGGSTSWANIRGLLTNNISGLHLFEEGSYKAKSIDVWGISDKHLFLEANDVLAGQQKPFIAVIQTSDNHRPYTIPSEDLDEFKKVDFPKDSLNKYGFDTNEELNAFRYTDFCYGKFMDAAKKEKYFNNTIFVFVGDHGIRGSAGRMFPDSWNKEGLTTQHVPLLFYSPALIQPQRFTQTASQVDILPTVAGMTKIPYRNNAMGRDLFMKGDSSLKYYHNAFLFDPDKRLTGMATADYIYMKDLASGKEDFVSAKNNDTLPSTPEIEENKKMLRDLTAAYYESAKYLLLHNKK